MLRFRSTSRTALIFCILFFSRLASAAEISVLDAGPDAPTVVFVDGEIVDGDAAEFDRATNVLSRAIVFLKSDGGLVRDALAIGSAIRMRGFSTSVVDGAQCYSACALIWVAGARRYLSPEGVIGVHAAYVQQDGALAESGMGNAEIGAYLAHLGLRIEAIRFFTASGPDSFLFVTPEVARAIGLEVHIIDNGTVTSPAEAPTVDDYAQRFVSLGTLRALCLGLFQIDERVMDLETRRAAEAGQGMVGTDMWIELWLRLADEVKGQVAIDGIIATCLRQEASLRQKQVNTGVEGPSFPCSQARTATEEALCVSPELWARDRAMNAVSLEVKKSPSAVYRKQVLTDQRAWMSYRDSCGSNVSCLAAAYDQRLVQFREMQVR